jgi:hypothetical protein
MNFPLSGFGYDSDSLGYVIATLAFKVRAM